MMRSLQAAVRDFLGKCNDPDGRTALFLLLLLYLPFAFAYGWHYYPIPHTDFPSFYWPARYLFESGLSPYDPAVLDAATERLGQAVYPLLYPPPSALLLFPLTAMPYETAKIAMLVVNHALIVLVGYLILARILRVRFDTRITLVLLAYFFLFEPIQLTLNHGQVNLVALAGLCVAWIGIREDRHPLWIALPLTVAVLVKTYPALVLVYLLVSRRYRAVVWTVAVLAVVCALSAILLPASLWVEYITEVLPTAGYGRTPHELFSPAAPWNQGFNGFFARLFLENEYSTVLVARPALTAPLAYACSAALFAATTFLCYRSSRRQPDGRGTDLELALFTAMMFLVSPLAWEHHLVFVLPAALLAVRSIVRSQRAWGMALTAGLAAILLAWDVPVESEEIKRGVRIFAISVKLYAVAVLWLYLALDLRTGHEGQGRQEIADAGRS